MVQTMTQALKRKNMSTGDVHSICEVCKETTADFKLMRFEGEGKIKHVVCWHCEERNR